MPRSAAFIFSIGEKFRLTTCNVAPQDVDAIFMTGGSSFVPVIRRLFERKFGGEIPIRAGQEFTSVAEGLAIHALELSA